MRKFIFIIVLFLGAALIYLSFSEIENIVKTLRHGNLWFILLAFLIQVFWYIAAGLTYQSLYELLGMQETVYKLSLLYASANFVNTVAPSAGVGGMAVFISAATHDGHSAGKVTIASMLSQLLDYNNRDHRIDCHFCHRIGPRISALPGFTIRSGSWQNAGMDGTYRQSHPGSIHPS
jgi:hypothetical protein